MILESHLPLTEIIVSADEAAVAATVRDACAARTPVYPLGGGTRLDHGVSPVRPGIGLSLASMHGVIDYPAADMTITVQAGITLAELARTLAARGQRLPVDVPQAERATVGGALATDASGPRRYAYGTLRDYVLGLRAVDGRGIAFATGGRVVKNAAGYNLGRLLIGSLGTLGIVTQTTLLVRPLPQSSALVACDLGELPMAEALLAGLVRTQTVPTAIELRVGPAPQASPLLGPPPAGCSIRLLVGFEGDRTEVQWMVARLGEEWRQAGVSSLTTISGPDAEPWWTWLADFPADLQIHTLPGNTVEMIARLRRLLPDCCLQAHAGNGVVRAQLCPSGDGPPPVSQAADGLAALLREKLRPAVAELGGKLVVLSAHHNSGLAREDYWGLSNDALAWMRAIKDRFDPAGILNPGRFVFEN
jgi:glycolate oxidase FAD binding subunit